MFSLFRRGGGGGGSTSSAANGKPAFGRATGSRGSLPGGGFGFLSDNDEIYAQAKALEQMTAGTREMDAALDGHRKEARALAEAVLARAESVESSTHGAGGDLGIRHPTAFAELRCFSTYVPEGCLFVGHTNTDMDSVASAIGGAHLFRGVACRSERDLNGEIQYALEFSGYAAWAGRSTVDGASGETVYGEAAKKLQAVAEEAAAGGDADKAKAAVAYPPFYDDVPGATDAKEAARGIVLVDHNEPGQMPSTLSKVAFPKEEGSDKAAAKAAGAMRSRIAGVIDHHALSERFKTAGPCFMDIRPWGSACSIVAHMYVRLGRSLPQPVARVLLCGILSDTINLTSPTTTDADRLMATLLVFLGGVEHPNQLASEMFKAKTRWFVSLGAYEMVRGDQKSFSAGPKAFGWATVEVTSAEVVLDSAADILLELRALKDEKGYDYVFLSVVDVLKKQTWLLLCGAGEHALALKAFGGATSAACSSDKFGELHATLKLRVENTKMDLGSKVSRKLEFVPPVVEVLSGGWEPPAEVERVSRAEEAPFAFVVKRGSGYKDGDDCCKLERRYSAKGAMEHAAHVAARRYSAKGGASLLMPMEA